MKPEPILTLRAITTKRVRTLVRQTTQQVETAILEGPGYVSLTFPTPDMTVNERVAWTTEIVALARRAQARPVGGRQIMSSLRQPGQKIDITWPEEILNGRDLEDYSPYNYPLKRHHKAQEWHAYDAILPIALDVHRFHKYVREGILSPTKVHQMIRRPKTIKVVNARGYVTELYQPLDRDCINVIINDPDIEQFPTHEIERYQNALAQAELPINENKYKTLESLAADARNCREWEASLARSQIWKLTNEYRTPTNRNGRAAKHLMTRIHKDLCQE